MSTNGMKSQMSKEAAVEGTSDVLILQDVSASMKEGARLGQCNLFVQWLANSLPETDRLGYVSFDSVALAQFQLMPIQTLRLESTLEKLLTGIRAQDKTALYEAIFLAVGQVLDKVRPTWLVIMSGGADDTSRFSVAFIETLLGRFPNVHLCFVQLSDDMPTHKHLAELTAGSYHLINNDAVPVVKSETAQSSTEVKPVSTTDGLIRQLYLTELLASAMQSILSNIHPNLALCLPTKQEIIDEPTKQ